MLRHKNIDRVCSIVLALTLLLSTLFVGAAASGTIMQDTAIGYETRLFDQSRVHTIEIVMEDWETFLSTCASEEYSACHLVIDGESYKNVAIRGKGNTSLTSVASYGNNRYSFKVEFDHYQTGSTYHGLDKLSLNNLIQDNTYMKDYMAYTLMGKMGVAAPLCSFVQVNVNGEPWGLYLAVEGVEDAFLQRNYGKVYGELYKPDSMSFGGGRGNGRDFDMDEMMEKFDFSFGEDGEMQGFSMPDMSQMPTMPGDGMPDMSQMPTMPSGGMPDMSQMPTMPGGGMPDMSQMPTMPSGGMPDMSQMPSMPDKTAPVQTTGGEDSEAAAETGTVPAMPTMPSMSRMGRGGGMGSNDVKLLYSDDDPDSYANIFNNAKTDVTDADQMRLIASLKALGEGDISVIDTDAVLRYMAVHNFLCNEDSYTGMMVHNYYLYEEDGVLEMIPWDYNLAYGTMSGGSDATSTVNTDIDSLVNGGGGDRPMADWITASTESLSRYHAVYQEFMSTVFDSNWFAQEIDRVITLISPYVQSDPTAFCTYEEFLTAAKTLKSFCLKRAESIASQLKGENLRVDASELDLSVMGSMDRGGFGFGGDKTFGRNGGSKGRRSQGEEVTENANTAESVPAVPPQLTEIPSETQVTPAASVQAPPGGMQMPAFDRMAPDEGGAESWAMLVLCAVLLLGAILFAAKAKGNQ